MKINTSFKMGEDLPDELKVHLMKINKPKPIQVIAGIRFKQCGAPVVVIGHDGTDFVENMLSVVYSARYFRIPRIIKK